MDTKRLSRVFAACTDHLKPVIVLSLSCSLVCLFAFIPKGDDPVDKLVTAMLHWTDKNPQEKVYLQLDKPYYAPGDTIWFKGYVTVGSRHQLSALSGALYVDLISAKDSVIRSLKLPVTSGMVMGDITLDDELKEGSYRIRAYTQWMRNAGEEYFFDHTFNIGQPKLNKNIAKGPLSQSDVQFFPESGNLVNSVSSRVAFKAVGVDGASIDIKGKIVDETNTEIAQLETQHAGMGSFLLRPEVGKTYTANVVFADGSTKNISLPKAVTDAYVLAVYQPNKDSILVRINTTQNIVATAPTLSFIAQVRGEVAFASPVKITRVSTSIWLDKTAFHSGIAQFTLFNDAGEPLNERVAFIRAKDAMDLKLSTVKGSYKGKEWVQVQLQALDSKLLPVAGNFSVSVIDETKVPFDESDESTIFSNLLLTSDIKGHVEKPNYYFTSETPEMNKALDNLMLTQGYRRFVWKDLADTTAKPIFPVEGLGVSISGTVQNLGKKIVPNANVMLMSLKAGVTKATTSDANGRFKFDGIFMTDSVKFTVQARTAKNSDKVKVILDSIPKMAITKNKNTAIGVLAQSYVEDPKLLEARLDRLHTLQQVEIRAKKNAVKDPDITPQGMLRINEASADKVISFTDREVADCATLSMCLQARLQGVTVTSKLGYTTLSDSRNGSIGLILNGRRITSNDEISEILEGSVQPADVAKILVVRTNQAMVNFLSGPAIMIITKVGAARKLYNPSVANVAPKGFNKAREFYSPRYDRPGNAAALPDLRTTVYWNPYLKTDTSGKTTFNFFNADGPGTYKVTVEGINAAGELGRAVYRYTVDGGQATISPPTNSTGDKNLAMIIAPLDSLNKRLPVEKVYLHTDKPYYNIGDTLWFKSYVVDANRAPSKLSGLLYVELDNDSSLMIRRISVPIKDGLGWAQIPLPRSIFREGGYTLRAYTNWMKNFGEKYVFKQRFYLGVPTTDAWLVRSAATIDRRENKDQLQVDLKLTHADNASSPVALKKVEVKIYDEWHYLYKEQLQTGLDGTLKFGHALSDSADARRIRVQLTSLEGADKGKVTHIPLTIDRKQNIDLQFLPEGGKLVAGLRSTVGFKAIGEDGKGTPVLGAIYDSKGTEVVSFAAVHNGMGSLEFLPKPGETYTARLSQPAAKTFELPKISALGTTLHIINAELDDKLKVSICSNVNTAPGDSACYLIGTSQGLIYYSQKVELNQPEISIAKKLFPSGIARFTLFKGKRPLNGRAVFIDNHDQLNIKITTNKAAYRKRDSVSLGIEVKDKSGSPVQGNFSLAVNDDSQVKPDSLGNYNMATSLLINSELKGNIESPGYYINRKDKLAWEALDNLLLTQGWTGYERKVVSKPTKPEVFEVEKGLKITGKVTTVMNKPVPNAPVLISSEKPNFITTVNTDSAGVYVLKNLPVLDSGSFFIQASKATGKKMHFGNVSVDKFKPLPVPTTYRDPVLPWYVNTDSAELNYVKRVAEKADDKNLKLKGIQLKQVDIKSKKIIKGSMNRFGAGEADLVFDEEDIKKSARSNLYELMYQKIPGFRVLGANKITFRGRDMVVPVLGFNGYIVDIRVDGWPVPLDIDLEGYSKDNDLQTNDIIAPGSSGKQSDLHEYSPMVADVINALSEYKLSGTIGLEVAWSRKFINRLGPMSIDLATIEITTRNGNGWYRETPPDVARYRMLPVMRPQQFYSPKYGVDPVAEPDLRSTIFWEPNITTDQNGKAKVSFYTSDIAGKYTVKVAGVEASGGIGDGSAIILTASKP